MRKLSEKFMCDLIQPDGTLHPILERVKKDHTLMLAIRDNYINIYYRGGNILKVEERRNGNYRASFDTKYNISGLLIPYSPVEIKNQSDAIDWTESFPIRKNCMDVYFSCHPKAEREYQQLIARENNNSSISIESEYFITDIELAGEGARSRFDMTAIFWPARQRRNCSDCKAVLIEMKYGDGALEGSASLLKHLKDIEEKISNEKKYLVDTIESQFNQLNELGLFECNKGSSYAKGELTPDEKPEVIFILANHNPRSSKLKTILGDPAFIQYAQSELFDLRFFVASFAGYGLHEKCMRSLSEFRELL